MFSTLHAHPICLGKVFTFHYVSIKCCTCLFCFFLPLSSLFSGQTLILTQMYTHSCRHAAPMNYSHNISKPSERDQNANGEHGDPCGLKKQLSRHNIFNQGLTECFRIQSIMHYCINCLAYLARVCNQWLSVSTCFFFFFK